MNFQFSNGKLDLAIVSFVRIDHNASINRRTVTLAAVLMNCCVQNHGVKVLVDFW